MHILCHIESIYIAIHFNQFFIWSIAKYTLCTRSKMRPLSLMFSRFLATFRPIVMQGFAWHKRIFNSLGALSNPPPFPILSGAPPWLCCCKPSKKSKLQTHRQIEIAAMQCRNENGWNHFNQNGCLRLKSIRIKDQGLSKKLLDANQSLWYFMFTRL